jgi:hypothetical protein
MTGRPNTRQRPEDQPDYNPMWKEMYAFSPTVEERSENPMPRMSNPDPEGTADGTSRIKGQERSRRQQICCPITCNKIKVTRMKKKMRKALKPSAL